MASTRGRLLVLGGNPVHGSDALDSRMGACLWDLSLGRTGDARLMGKHFRVGCWFFSWGGRGRGKGAPGHGCRGVFADDAGSKRPCYMLYIIYCAVEVSLFHASGRRERWPRSSLPWGRHVRCSGFDSPSTGPAPKTVKVLLLLVPHGLHGAVGMMFMHMQSMLLYVICLLHVYVCYMLLYVICLLYVIYLLYV